jgi:hypothetical protein
MRQVYSPSNSAEAPMLVHQLEQAGIKAHLHGEALQGGVGELPAGGLLQLMVADEDYAEARRLLKTWEETAPADAAPTAPQFPTLLMLTFFAAGVLGGWVGKGMFDNSRFTFIDGRQEFDSNGDGRMDVTYFYRPGAEVAHRVDADNNYDDRVDSVALYDAVGNITGHRFDNDFDGVMEGQSTFRNGQLVESRTDLDNNGVHDLTSTYEHGVLVRERYFDERSGQIARVNYYEAGVLVRSESDPDRDGVMETMRTYDRYGEVVNTEESAR